MKLLIPATMPIISRTVSLPVFSMIIVSFPVVVPVSIIGTVWSVISDVIGWIRPVIIRGWRIIAVIPVRLIRIVIRRRITGITNAYLE